MNAQSKVTVRRQREIARTRADILEAALRAFGRRGVTATTMQDIAHEADYSAASLYSYFENKDAISEGIVTLLSAELLAVFDAPVAPGADFAAKIEALVARHLAHADARCDAFAAMQEGAQRAPCAPGSIYDQQLTRAATWMRDESTRTDRGGASPEDAACAFVGIVSGFFRRWMLRDRTGSLVQQADTITRFFLHGLGAMPTASMNGRGSHAASANGRGSQATSANGRGSQAASANGRGSQATSANGRGSQATSANGRGSQATPSTKPTTAPRRRSARPR